MNNPKISLIAAISKNRVLGKGNELIFRIPEDQKRFREITSGHAVIMGRKTYESIGRPLPKRINIVITREQGYSAPGCIVVHDLSQALDKARETENEEVFVIGGGQIYSQAIALADKLYLTIVDQEAEGDAFFPDYSEFKKIVFKAEGRHEGINYVFLDLVK